MVQLKDFEKLIHESVEFLAKEIVREDVNNNRLLPVKAQEKKAQVELETHIKNTTDALKEGLQLSIGALSHCSQTPMSATEVAAALQSACKKIDTPDALIKFGTSCFSEISWKQYLEIPDACMDTLYQGAKYLFDAALYRDSEKAFFALCAFDPMMFTYWVGYGHSCFQEGHYEQAISSYCMASQLDSEHIWPHIWAANSFEKIDDHKHAKMALQEALNLEKAKDTPDREIIVSLEQRL